MVLLILSILLNIVMNLHLKVEKLHFEVNITMIKYAFKIESFVHQFIDVPGLTLCSLAFSVRCTFQILGVFRVGGQGCGDNSIQFISFGGWVTKVLKNGDKK